MRIHILGPSGSGKTTAAREIASRLSIPHFDLDDLRWMNEQGTYGRPRPTPLRERRIKEIIAASTCITEGVYAGWALPFIQAADILVFMDSPRRLRFSRLYHRYRASRNGDFEYLAKRGETWTALLLVYALDFYRSIALRRLYQNMVSAGKLGAEASSPDEAVRIVLRLAGETKLP